MSNAEKTKHLYSGVHVRRSWEMSASLLWIESMSDALIQLTSAKKHLFFVERTLFAWSPLWSLEKTWIRVLGLVSGIFRAFRLESVQRITDKNQAVLPCYHAQANGNFTPCSTRRKITQKSPLHETEASFNDVMWYATQLSLSSWRIRKFGIFARIEQL